MRAAEIIAHRREVENKISRLKDSIRDLPRLDLKAPNGSDLSIRLDDKGTLEVSASSPSGNSRVAFNFDPQQAHELAAFLHGLFPESIEHPPHFHTDPDIAIREETKP